jgi:hypothetical protein
MSKAFYLGSFIGSMTLLFFLSMLIVRSITAVPDNTQIEDYPLLELVLLFIPLFAVSIYYNIVLAIMLYKIWKAIEERGTSIFPALSIILLIIPLVNLFWVIIVFPLYIKYYNEYVERWELNVKELDPGIFYTFPLFLVTCIVGIGVGEIFKLMPESSLQEVIILSFGSLGILGFFVSFVVFLVIVSRLCDAVNSLPHVKGGFTARRPYEAV